MLRAVADTHAVIWYIFGDQRLSNRKRSLKHLQAETQAELAALLPAVLDRAFRGEL